MREILLLVTLAALAASASSARAFDFAVGGGFKIDANGIRPYAAANGGGGLTTGAENGYHTGGSSNGTGLSAGSGLGAGIGLSTGANPGAGASIVGSPGAVGGVAGSVGRR